MKTKIFLTGLAFLAATTMINAQSGGNGNGNGRGQGKGACKGQAYVDNNKNGVCDNYENRKGNAVVKNGKGKGKCDGTGQGKGNGKNFVDANKNGICDHYENRNAKE